MIDSSPAPSSPLPSVPAQPDMARRSWLYGAVAGAATLAGLALAWRNRQPDSQTTASATALWDLTFETPDRTRLSLKTFAGKPLVLNFWATWCPPCVEELPLLDRFYQENSHNGWQVLGIAADQLNAVQTFLGRTPVRFPVGLAGMQGIELSKTLGNMSGGLPFTVVLGSSGQVLHRKIGRLSSQDLLLWGTLK